MLITGLTAYFKELAKAYHVAANKLEAVAKAIETGDTTALDKNCNDYFRNLARHLMQALQNGAMQGYIESVLSTGLGHGLDQLGGFEPGTTGSQIVDGLTAGGVSAAGSALGEEDSSLTPNDLKRFSAVLSR